jgi:tetratricopeptide (TPR) repeat protein
VQAVARLTEVNIPEKLRGVDKESSVPILKALYEATLATVNERPDTDDTRGAKAVSLQLLSDMQLREGDLAKALATCGQALALGTAIAKRHPDAENQRNLAVYYVTRGNILEGLDRSDEALAAYELARSHAESDPNKRALWYIYMLLADIQLRQQPADALRQKQYEAVLAACTQGLKLAEDRARTEKDVRSQSDLAYNYDKMGQALEAQGDWYAETQKKADARRCWTDALKNLQSAKEVIGRLARDNADPQAIRNLPKITQEVAGMERKLGSAPHAG